MSVAQCPECKLKFRFDAELDDHVARDHPHFRADHRTIEDSVLGAAHRIHLHLPDYPPRYRPDVSVAVGPDRISRSPISITHRDGDHFDVRIRHHHIEVDQPVEDGGQDLAATPTELFVAAIAACVAFYGRRFLKRHGLPQDLTVDASWALDHRPARVARIDLSVKTGRLPADQAERLARVIDHCTLHNSLRDPPEVGITLVR